MRLFPRSRSLGLSARTMMPARVNGVAAERRVIAVEGASSPGAPMEPEWDAETAIRWGVYANTFVYACLRANGEDVASMPFRAGTDQEKQTDYDDEAPLARLLGPQPGTPSPEITAEQLWAWSLMQLRASGRFAWEVARTSGRVTGLWPLPAHRVRPIPSSGGSSYWAGFEYETGRGKRRLSSEQVIYHWRPSQLDWREPESSLQAARLDISVAVMQDRYDNAFLRNDARPASVVVHEAFAESEDKDAWRSQFLDRFQGPDNAGRVHFVEADPQGAKPTEAIAIHALGLTQRDAEFIKRYQAKVDAITVGLGTPLSRLGNASGRTFSNSGQEEVNYWRHTIRPLHKDLSAAVNMQLVPMLPSPEVGWFEELGVPALQPPRRFSDTDVPTLVNEGMITVNEGRAMLGLEPVPGGDAFRIPIKVQPPAPKELGPGEPEEPEPAGELPPASEESVEEEEGSRHRTYAEARYAIVVYQERAIAAQQNDLDVLERMFMRKMQQILDRQQREVVRRLTGKRGRQAVRQGEGPPSADGLFDRAYWEGQTAEEFIPLYETVLGTAAGAVPAALELAFDLDSPQARAFLSTRANMLAGHVTQTTYNGINAAMRQGMEEGLSIPGLAERIRGLFEQTYARRAETVARTEVVSAYNGATHAIGTEAPGDVIAGYEWLATLDARTRRHHTEAHGQVVQRGELFTVGGAQMRFPGDPAGGPRNTVNCRCTMLALTPEEMRERLGTPETRPDPSPARFRGLTEAGEQGQWRETLERITAFADDRDSWEAMPEGIRDAISAYRGSGYRKINRSLRGQIESTPELDQWIGDLDDAFVRHGTVLDEDVLVTRQLDPGFADRMLADDVFVDHGYTSTALKGHAGSPYVDEVEIIVPAGSRVLGMSSAESELLLPRGSRYRVVRREGEVTQMVLENATVPTARAGRARRRGDLSQPVDVAPAERFIWQAGDLQSLGDVLHADLEKMLTAAINQVTA